MSVEFDFLTPTDKPALLGLSTPELQDTAKTALDQLGYKIHTAVNHGEFLHKFTQVSYHVVILEEMFSASTPQAFQQGVHAVVNPSEMFLLIQLVQKAVADNDLFLHAFRDAQKRLA